MEVRNSEKKYIKHQNQPFSFHHYRCFVFVASACPSLSVKAFLILFPSVLISQCAVSFANLVELALPLHAQFISNSAVHGCDISLCTGIAVPIIEHLKQISMRDLSILGNKITAHLSLLWNILITVRVFLRRINTSSHLLVNDYNAYVANPLTYKLF